MKVLNQNGIGSTSSVARSIVYFAQLKMGPLKNVPLVVNMSLSGEDFDGMIQAAVDYAISKGVILVAAAGMVPVGKDNASGAGFITADKALRQ